MPDHPLLGMVRHIVFLGGARARENEQAWAGGSERPGEHGSDLVGADVREERRAGAHGRGGGRRLARREQEPGDGPAGDEERGARVEQHGAGAGVLRVGLSLARPACVGLAAVGRIEEGVVRAPARGRDDPAHEGEGTGAPEADGHGVADRGSAGARVGRHDGRGARPAVGLDGRVDPRPEGHRHAQLVGVTGHGHVQRVRVAPDLGGEGGVREDRGQDVAGEGEGLDRLGRGRRAGGGAAGVLSLELRALGAGGSDEDAGNEGAPLVGGDLLDGGSTERHPELIRGLRDRVDGVRRPLRPQGVGELAAAEAGRRGEHVSLVLDPLRDRENRQRSVGRRERTARGGDPARVRQGRRGGLRGGRRLPEGDGRRTEHGEKRENGQTAVHDVTDLRVGWGW